MKKKDLEKAMRYFGWYFIREGSRHEIWTNGERSESIPRHREINENLAKKILRIAKENPPKEV